MLESRATVVRLEGEDAIVESAQGGGCGHCASEGGCGSGKLSQLFCTQPRQFRVRNDIHAQIGDEVHVSVADGVLLRSALTLYGLPLLLLLCGSLMGTYLVADPGSRDGAAAIGAASGLLMGFLLAKWLGLKQASSYFATPIIVRSGKLDI